MKKFTKLIGLCLAFFLLLSGLPTHLNAQNVRKHIFDFRGDSLHFLEYKPAGHNSPGNTRQYPLIVFLHGIGEKNNSSTGLTKLESNGLPQVIRDGNPMSFTWNGVTDTFIVLSPMCRYSRPDTPNIGIWPSDYIHSMINYAKANLRVDTNRVYLTGLSFGGGGTLRFISLGLANAQKLAAAASVCPPYHYNIWDAPSPNFESNVRDANLPFRSYHAADDTIAPVGASRAAVNRINTVNPPSPVKALLTEWPTGGHVIWDRVYEDNLSGGGYDGVVTLYEWFLGQNKSLPVNILPVANVGSDITISTTTGTATLNGSASTDADGTIVRYVWKKIPGSVAGTITTPFGSASSTTVSGLTTAGVYQYELIVVDDRAAIARDTLTVTVVSSGTNAVTMSSSGRITTGDVTQLNNAPKFTLEAQFKYDATVSGWTTIMRKSISLNDRIMLHIGPSNNSVYVMVGNGSNSYGYTAANAVSPGTWYHVAAVFDGTQTGDANRLKLYINGVQQTLSFSATAIPATTSSINTGPFMAGGEPSCCYLNGTIDEVRVWNTALSAGTITAWKDKLLGDCHPNLANLVVYWPLNNNANPATATAALGTAYTGTITNGTYVSSNQATDTTGCGKALTISSSGRITTGNVTQLNSASKFTLEALFKYDATVSSYTTIMRKSTSLSDRIMVHIGPSNNSIHLVVANGSNSYGVTGANAVSPGTWYHLAAVFDGTQTGDANRLKLYINGVQQALSFSATPIPAGTSSTNTAPFIAGGEPSCCYLNGTIDEVRVWNTALSASTINDWKEKLLGSCHPDIANLVVYWPLNNNATPAVATAELGTAYTGTITNGSYVTTDQATTPSGCSGARTALPSSLEEVKENKLFTGKIYPNPTEGFIQIELNASIPTSVTVNVLDMSGRYLYRNRSPLVKGNNRISLNIASLPSGIYIIEVGDGKAIVEKYKVLKR